MGKPLIAKILDDGPVVLTLVALSGGNLNFSVKSPDGAQSAFHVHVSALLPHRGATSRICTLLEALLDAVDDYDSVGEAILEFESHTGERS